MVYFSNIDMRNTILNVYFNHIRYPNRITLFYINVILSLLLQSDRPIIHEHIATY